MSESKPGGFALDSALLLALATGLLFVAGWGYAERWFGLFDLGVVGLGIPSGYFAMYGYWTLEWLFWWLTPLALLAAAAPLLRCWLRERLALARPSWPRLCADPRPALHSAARILAPLALLAVFWAVSALGRHAASKDFARHSSNRFCDFPFVRVVLKENAAWPEDTLPHLREDLAAGRYRLLIQSGGVLALFRLNPPDAPRLPRLPGLIVPVGEVSLFEQDPVPPGCGPG